MSVRLFIGVFLKEKDNFLIFGWEVELGLVVVVLFFFYNQIVVVGKNRGDGGS